MELKELLLDRCRGGKKHMIKHCCVLQEDVNLTADRMDTLIDHHLDRDGQRPREEQKSINTKRPR